jgi:plastocyanin
MSKLFVFTVLTVLATGWSGESFTPRSGETRVSAGTASRVAIVFGQVAVSASPDRPPPSLSPYARRRYRPPQEPGVAGGTEDAVVYLEPVDGTPQTSVGDPVRIIQHDRTIVPHVSVAQVASAVQFPNDDDVFHNIFSLSSGNRFSLGRYGPGVTKTHRFENTGVVRLFCDIHAEMAGVILVLDTPYATRIGRDGSYRLTGIPAAAYRAIAWHPDAGADTTVVDLRDGEERRVDFQLRSSR